MRQAQNQELSWHNVNTQHQQCQAHRFPHFSSWSEMVSITNCSCQANHLSHLGSWFEKLSINSCCQVGHFSHFGSRFKVASSLQIWHRRRFTPRAQSSDLTTAKPRRTHADNAGAESTRARTRAHRCARARARTQSRAPMCARASLQRLRCIRACKRVRTPAQHPANLAAPLLHVRAPVSRFALGSGLAHVSARIASSFEKIPK